MEFRALYRCVVTFSHSTNGIYSVAKFKGFPIFDTADRLSEQADQNGYPDVATRLSKLPLKYELLERDLTLSFQYLLDYTGTRSLST